MKRIVMVACIFAMLSACAHVKKEGATVPPPPKTIVILPPDDLIPACQLTPPPDKRSFIRASKDVQLNMALKNDAANIKNIGDCNVPLGKLHDWKADKKKKYENDPSVSIQE